MEIPSGERAIGRAAESLAEMLDATIDRVEIERLISSEAHADAVVKVEGVAPVFVLEWKSSATAAAVSGAAESVAAAGGRFGEDAVPIVVVPYMGRVGRERCDRAGVSWLDLSGNARIVAPGLRILIDGRPNRFQKRGRPSSPFAPKAARITRWILMHPSQALTQRELARATGVDEGYASRVVGRLEEDRLVQRDDLGAITVRDPDLLLDAWLEVYDFDKHEVMRGHVPSRAGELLVRQLGEQLRERSIEHALTGLGAAWLMTHFAGFRLATFYLVDVPSTVELQGLSFREEEKGANVWLVVPNDDGVFHGAQELDGMRCVHPVQAFLDLQWQPERAKEAAAELRSRTLKWTRHV